MNVRTMYKKKAWLERQYSTLQKSAYEIARACKCTPRTIYTWLHKFRIPVRSYSEARCLKSNHISLSKGLLQFINGLLLGDGHLHALKWSATFQASSKHKSFLQWLSKKFSSYGIKQAGKIHRGARRHLFPNGKIYSYVDFAYASRYYAELKNLWSDWYRRDGTTKKGNPKYKKVTPTDLKLTPLSCLHWYIGDGYLNKSAQNITLHTLGFSHVDVEFLKSLLKDLGLIVSVHADSSIFIWKKSVRAFLSFIGPCPKEIKAVYGYKWLTCD